MWQLYALGGLLFSAGEEVVDKIVIVGDLAIDTFAATFYRNAVYFLFAAAAGALGIVGALTFLVTWPILLVAALAVGSSVFYTYLLKHIELTGSMALDYSRPVVFLLIDVLVIRIPFTAAQILGILLLVLGGLLFVINLKTKRLKPEYTKYVWMIFIFETFSYIAEFYVFKHYVATRNLNEISYIFSTYIFVVLGLFILMVWKSNWPKIAATAVHNKYMAKIGLSKAFDLVYSLFWFHALKLGTVSQVNAMDAFYPLILISVLYIVQQRLKFKAGEKFDRLNSIQKIIGTAILILGIWLAG